MRGTPLVAQDEVDIARIIPAHAGNSCERPGVCSVTSDHPRACGELPVVKGRRVNRDGSSPRMRGTLALELGDTSLCRIIPAHAGNSPRMSAAVPCSADHPRACGELSTRSLTSASRSGSSPRMRGTPIPQGSVAVQHRIIPAHAGNSSRAWGCPSTVTDHPRACGELRNPVPAEVPDFGSSPRMRGTRGRLLPSRPRQRIIPAHAGNSSHSQEPGPRQPDHPRACGELSSRIPLDSVSRGSSPRMRGTRWQPHVLQAGVRIIPAHAGNSLPINHY